jgi:hypothetical protein
MNNSTILQLLKRLFIACCAGCLIAQALAAPQITCEEPIFDFGTRDTAEVVVHSFTLKNTGDEDLLIHAVRPACGCTAARLPRQSIPPGESVDLSTQLTLAGRTGSMRKTIRIDSNDPSTPSLELALVGKTTTDVEILPPVLVLKKNSPSQPATGSVRIKSTDGSQFEITEMRSASGKIKLRADTIPGESAYQISAHFDDTPPTGQHSDTITISTTLKGGKTLTLPATVVATAPIAAAPARIVLEESPEPTISRTIVLKAPKSEQIEIDRIELPDPRITKKSQRLGKFGWRIVFDLPSARDLIGKKVQVVFTSGQIVEIPIEFKATP